MPGEHRWLQAFRLERDSAVPLYVQLANEMRQSILGGTWSLGSRIPSEASLAAGHGISRNTVRLALQAIANEGLIVRQPGKGSFVARSLSTGTLHRFIGFVAPYSRDLLPGRMLVGVQRVARQHGYHVVFGDSAGHLEEENALLEKLVREGIVHHIVWPTSQPGSRYLTDHAKWGGTVVQIDRYLPQIRASYVGSDNFGGGVAATRHLIGLGHTEIAFLAFRGIDVSTVRERHSGYEAAMHEAGLDPQPPVILPYREEVHLFEHGLAALEEQRGQTAMLVELLSRPDRPSALVGMNDLAAYQALKSAEAAGLRVPDDLAVVGFDDVDFCAQLEVPLTSVAQDPVGIGQQACELLIRHIGDVQSEPVDIRLPVRLVVRASTAGVREVTT